MEGVKHRHQVRRDAFDGSTSQASRTGFWVIVRLPPRRRLCAFVAGQINSGNRVAIFLAGFDLRIAKCRRLDQRRDLLERAVVHGTKDVVTRENPFRYCASRQARSIAEWERRTNLREHAGANMSTGVISAGFRNHAPLVFAGDGLHHIPIARSEDWSIRPDTAGHRNRRAAAAARRLRRGRYDSADPVPVQVSSTPCATFCGFGVGRRLPEAESRRVTRDSTRPTPFPLVPWRAPQNDRSCRSSLSSRHLAGDRSRACASADP